MTDNLTIDKSLEESKLRYASVIEELYGRHRSVRDAGFSGEAYKPGIEAMSSFSEFLGHPERQFRSVHVAGTNGKGSVCSMLAAALAARGLRVGLYTSPHLIDFRERIKIISESLPEEGCKMQASDYHGSPSSRCGETSTMEMIPEEAVCRFVERFDKDGLTFFEITTGMAFWWFAEQKVDIAVIETGLGGRLDSTNIIRPEISVITSIGLDHCDLLGDTRAQIAKEKAGIFKLGVPALVWGRDPETQAVFERVASETGAMLYFAEDYPLSAAAQNLLSHGDAGLDRAHFGDACNSLAGLDVAGLDIAGPCQDTNLRTVLAALAILDGAKGSPATQVTVKSQIPKDWQAIANAARITGFRGRWEQLLNDPQVLCDIGHNPPALAANFAKLNALRNQQQPPRPLIIVYGAMKDKDVDGIKHYLPDDAEYYLVQPQTPRAMPLAELALKLKQLRTVAAGSVAQGVTQALERAKQLPGAIIFICGSTFVVSEAIKCIESL